MSYILTSNSYLIQNFIHKISKIEDVNNVLLITRSPLSLILTYFIFLNIQIYIYRASNECNLSRDVLTNTMTAKHEFSSLTSKTSPSRDALATMRHSQRTTSNAQREGMQMSVRLHYIMTRNGLILPGDAKRRGSNSVRGDNRYAFSLFRVLVMAVSRKKMQEHREHYASPPRIKSGE